MNWPKMIKEKKTVEHITAFWDFLPTVTELVGAKKVKGIDGISYLPLLIGNGDVARNHEYIYYEFYEQGGKQSILKDGWKLVRLNMSKPGELQEELYYLPDDVGEEKNLIRQNSPKADELRKLAMKARTESEYFNGKKRNEIRSKKRNCNDIFSIICCLSICTAWRNIRTEHCDVSD